MLLIFSESISKPKTEWSGLESLRDHPVCDFRALKCSPGLPEQESCMHIVINRRLEATNPWSRHRTLEVRLCGIPAEQVQAEQVAALFESLAQVLLPTHLAMATGFPEIPATDNGWAHLVALTAVELQRGIGQPPFQCYVASVDGPGRVDSGLESVLALECLEFEVAAAILRAAANLVTAIHWAERCDAAMEFEQVRAADETYSLGDATGPIVAAARRRGLPILRLDDQSRIQFGEGVYARRIRKAATDITGFVAEQASTDKAYTKQLWSRLGIPVPAGRVVEDADDAIKAALELGWPVVVKPLDSDYSNGVTLNVRDSETARAAYQCARQESESVLVERSLYGAVHRFLVVEDRIVSAVRRDPAGVTGDGRRTIRDLVDCENQSSRRGPDERWPLHWLRLETEELSYLAEQGLSPNHVPTPGQRIELRREPFLTAGGETHEVLDQVHPETLDLVRDAVRVVGLDVAGIDLIARDISLPLAEQGGGLLELNAQPAICLHLAPFNDRPQPVGEAIIQSLFPQEVTARIPLGIVVGNVSDSANLAALAQVLVRWNGTVAVSTPGCTRVANRPVLPKSEQPFDRLAAMTLSPRASGACLVVTSNSLIECGLGTEHCRILVLLDSGSDLDMRMSRDLAKLAPRLLATADSAVVNIDDPVWRSLIEPGQPSMVLASRNGGDPMLIEHLQAGGTVAVLDGSRFCLRSQSIGDTDWRRTTSKDWVLELAKTVANTDSSGSRGPFQSQTFQAMHVA